MFEVSVALTNRKFNILTKLSDHFIFFFELEFARNKKCNWLMQQGFKYQFFAGIINGTGNLE